MAKKKPRVGRPSVGESGPTPPRQFRLGDETIADLDLIAAFYTRERRKTQSRADAVRIAAAREADRIRKLEGQK